MNEPFSRPLIAANIPAGGKRQRIEADPVERERLAALLGIPEVTSLAADVEVRPGLGQVYRVRGSLEASVLQTDVVTLEPIAQQVAEAFQVSLVPAERAGVAQPNPSGDIMDAGPDVFHGGRIDLGVIVREHLALALDPYPRAPGVEFPGHIEDDPLADPSPFAVLSGLQTKEP